MTELSLEQLFKSHSGKVADKWELYLAEYDRLLGPYRQSSVYVLEIGVQNGGSLEIWGKYFTQASQIIGCDINPDCARLEFEDERIVVITGDANSEVTESHILEHAQKFDIIIDDGSHTSEDIVRSFARYFRHLAAGGSYIIEDLHCSYWREFEGGLFAPHSAVAFLKTLADAVNAEQWGTNWTSKRILRIFEEKYEIELTSEDLEEIHSVEFVNSMCLVRKSANKQARPGSRVIAGSQEPVVEGHLDLPGDQTIHVYPQESNPWSNLDLLPGSEQPGDVPGPSGLAQMVDERDEVISGLHEAITSQHDRIVGLEQQLAHFEELLQARREDLENRDARLTALGQRLEERNAQLLTSSQEVVAQRALLDYIRGERSWRWTAFFRRLGNRRVFDRHFYLERYPDIVKSGMDPLEHYVAYGRREGREATPPTKAGYYGNFGNAFRSLVRIEGGVWKSLKALAGTWRNDGASGVRARLDVVLGEEELIGYTEWVRAYGALDSNDRNRIRKRIQEMTSRPLISVVMPTYNTKLAWLKEAVESVRAQAYPHWELCIADDASTDSELKRYLEALDREDKQIKVVFRKENGHIAEASNSALEMCSGEWVALLDHDDLLAEHALFCVAEAINKNVDLALIYSDEDKVDMHGQRFDPYFKTEWNRDLFYSHNMISHLGVYRKDILDEIGGFRPGLEGSQDYDLALRCIEKIEPGQIHHIPRVLYHWRMHSDSTASGAEAKPYAITAAEKALQEHFDRHNVAASIQSLSQGYRVHYELPESPPLVTLIIPTRNAKSLVSNCIGSILEKTLYPNYEILIVDNASDDPEAIEYFEKTSEFENIRVIRDERPFNYSGLNNQAVSEAKGELIAFLNNDIEVISAEWLSELVSVALQPGVGAVGAKLLYPNDTVQHAGVILGVGGVAAHAFKDCPANSSGYVGRAVLMSSFSAVTAACMVIRKERFLEAGQFDEVNLPVAFGDVDVCLKLRELGYRNVFSPYARLYHHESATRGIDDTPEKKSRFDAEVLHMKERWGDLLENDPAYNPNLTIHREDFSLAWPPRVGVVGD